MAGRRTKQDDRGWTPQKVRDRIATGVVLNRLHDHVLGKIDLTPTQVAAARILLNKTVPDLASIEHSGQVEQKHYVAELPMQTFTGEQWLQLQNELSSGAQSRVLNSPS